MSWNPSVGSGNHCVCLTGCEAQSNVLPKAIFECHCNLYCLALPRANLTLGYYSGNLGVYYSGNLGVYYSGNLGVTIRISKGSSEQKC